MTTRSAAQNLAKTAISRCTAARGSASAKAPGKIPHLARSGQVVAERLKQPGLRAELVIHGGPGHVGPPGHRVHGERLIAGRLGQSSRAASSTRRRLSSITA